MLRLIIIAAALYILYRVLNRMLGQGRKNRENKAGAIVDELVQDPQCKLYIPKGSSIRKTIGGRAYSFCSEECARRFEEEK